MPASLVAIRGPSAGKSYRLDKADCVLGRSFNSEIYVGDLNVSRRHARITRSSDGYTIEDLGSGNGTFVNDKQVEQHRLVSKDVVRIGGSSFRFEPRRETTSFSSDVLTVIGDLADVVDSHTGEFRYDPFTTAQHLEAIARDQLDLSGLSSERAAELLELVFAVADAIARELDMDTLLNKILSYLFEVFEQVERGFVLLVDGESGQLVPEAVRYRGGRPSDGLAFSQTMVDQVMKVGEGVIRGKRGAPARPAKPGEVRNVDTTGQTKGSSTVPKMGAPLLVRGEVLGTLHLEGKDSGPEFSREDLAVLSAIARQAALAIANARAHRQLAEQARLEADLQMARKIQNGFLPRKLPQVAGLQFDTHYSPAQHVGGDFYDVIELTPTRIGILVGDVSGKGVSAALLMARLTTAIRLFARSNPDPGAVLTHANKTLMETEQDVMFATVLFMLLDLEQQTYAVANAGHQPPLVCSTRFEGVSELDDATAVALGVVADTEYGREVYRLVPNDVVVLYTDGINEALNRQKEEYGMSRLRRSLTSGPVTPSRVVQRIRHDMRRFVGSENQSDDQTIVAFGITRP